MIYELHTCTPQQAEQIEALMHVLSEHPAFSAATLSATLSSPLSHLFVAEEDGQIVGCATLCVFHSPTGSKASVEDVVVLPAYQGRHLGRALMETIIDVARQYAPITVQLTSRPSRTAARSLYQSMGFETKDTGFFRLKL